MEHRWSPRKSITGSVVVECPRLGRVYGTLRDISLGGMFIDTGNTSLPLNAPVAVSAGELWAGGADQDGHLQAMVVRRAPGGAGLMFLGAEADVLRALHGVLFGTRPASVPQVRARVAAK